MGSPQEPDVADCVRVVCAFARLVGIVRGVSDGLIVADCDKRYAVEALTQEADRAERELERFIALMSGAAALREAREG